MKLETPCVRPVAWLALAALSLCAASAPAAAPMGFDEARHLLVRTGYAASVAEIETYSRLSRGEAAERLLTSSHRLAVTPPPPWVHEPFESLRRLRAMSPEERKAFRRDQIEKGLELRAWWLTEMLNTSSPLTEKMTLFWHNHFVSSQQKVRVPQLLYRQNLLLRRHALGNFGEFLHDIAKDPAMVIYLDSASNRKAQPNENFAREVMELFTLGEGRYTERDVKEAARAFTGWSIDPDTGEFLFRRFQHDGGVKTVLGKTGNFDGDAVLDVLLAREETAQLIVTKLWREFVSPQPDPAEVGRIAARFRASGYNIKSALRDLFTSNAFYALENRASLIKSPVDLVVGTLRQFGFAIGDALPFVVGLAQLGQNLFSPPNVKGWPGGEAWINSAALLQRKALLDRLFRAEEMRPMLSAMAEAGDRNKAADKVGGRARAGRERMMRAMAQVHFDGQRWLSQFAPSDSAQVTRVVLAMAPVHAVPNGVKGIELIRHLTQDPVYQLR